MKFIKPNKNDRFSALVVGPSGIGKTSLLRTIPPEEPVCVLSAEGGLMAVEDLVADETVTGVEIFSLSDLKEAYMALATDKAWIEAYRWVFIDSLTEIDYRCYENGKKVGGSNGFKKWALYQDEFTEWVRLFRDLSNFNVVFTCLETVQVDLETKTRYSTMNLKSAKMAPTIHSFFDEVFYMTLRGKERVFRTDLNVDRPGKDRSRKLNRIEPADLAHIRDKMFGHKEQR